MGLQTHLGRLGLYGGQLATNKITFYPASPTILKNVWCWILFSTFTILMANFKLQSWDTHSQSEIAIICMERSLHEMGPYIKYKENGENLSSE